jgi:hypothetical protein
MEENQEVTPAEETAVDAVIVPEEGPTKELIETINRAGINPSIGSRIAMQMAVFFQAADEYRATSDSIVINSIDEVDKMKLADDVRLALKRKRLSATALIKSERDSLKVKMADDILHDKLLLHIGKMIEATMGNIETALEQKSKYRELYMEQVRQDRNVVRTPIFGELGIDIPSFDYLGMSDNEFELWISGVRKQVEDDKLKAKQEEERLQAEENARIERERIEKEEFDRRTKLLVDAGIVYDGKCFYLLGELVSTSDNIKQSDLEFFESVLASWSGIVQKDKLYNSRLFRLSAIRDLIQEGEARFNITKLDDETGFGFDLSIDTSDEEFESWVAKANEFSQSNEAHRLAKAEEKRQQEIKDAEERARQQEKERLEKEAKDKAAAEAKAKAEAEAKQKADEEAARKKALLAPDKEKFFEFSKKIEALQVEIPKSQSEEAQKLSVEIDGLLKKVVDYINNTASKF